MTRDLHRYDLASKTWGHVARLAWVNVRQLQQVNDPVTAQAAVKASGSGSP